MDNSLLHPSLMLNISVYKKLLTVECICIIRNISITLYIRIEYDKKLLHLKEVIIDNLYIMCIIDELEMNSELYRLQLGLNCLNLNDKVDSIFTDDECITQSVLLIMK